MGILELIVGALFALLFSTGGATAQILSSEEEEVFILQQRLKDSGCYTGALDRKKGAALEAAIKACPSQQPFLQIETGMHSAPIESVSADGACRLLVTGSHDKTVRLWSLPDGRLLRTQRLPIDEGDLGKINSVAMSLDGKLVAAGGWDAIWKAEKPYGVYLFDTATGSQTRHVGTFADAIVHLAFSPDGKRLAVALGGDGIRVLDVETGQELMADNDYAGTTAGIAFSNNGTLFAIGQDGYLRLYQHDLNRVLKAATRGKRPLSISVDPSGQQLAVGYFNTVEILDASNLKLINTIELQADKGPVFPSLAWSADGRFLFGASEHLVMIDSSKPNGMRRWFFAGQHLQRNNSIKNNSVKSLATCGSSIAFGSTDSSFGLIRANGIVDILSQSKIPDMRDKLAEAFTVSTDGTILRFGLKRGLIQPILFDLKAGIVKNSGLPLSTLYAADTTALNISDWKNSTNPTLDHKRIQLEQREKSYSLAVRPDRRGFLLGTDWFLRSYDAKGQVRWEEEMPHAVWGLNLARNGELVIAVCADGTVRWHRWSDGKQLLALLVHNDGKRWIAWTTSGYYMASAGADELIGWHANRGWEQPADFFPIVRFRNHLYRPDIVRLLLKTLNEDEAIKRANEVAKRPILSKSILVLLPR